MCADTAEIRTNDFGRGRQTASVRYTCVIHKKQKCSRQITTREMDDLEIFCVDIIKSWIRADYDASIKSKSICYPSSEYVLSCASKIENGLGKIEENSVADRALNESQRDCAFTFRHDCNQ